MKKQPNSRIFSGLARKVIAPVLIGAAALVGGEKAEGGNILLKSDFGTVNAPDVNLYHQSGIDATDGFDLGKDGAYTIRGSPVVDFYSQIPGNNLTIDRRDITSTSTFNTYMFGNGLTDIQNGTLEFIIGGLNDFQNQNVWADIYKGTTPFLTGIDVKAYDAENKKIDLSLANGESYNINVGFGNPIQTHTLTAEFWKEINGTWIKSPDAVNIIYSNQAGVSDLRNDSLDVKGPNWTNNFKNTNPGETFIYTVKAPFSSDRNSTDARTLTNPDPVLIEMAHNSTEFNGGKIELSTSIDDREFFKDYKVQQRQPGGFNHDNGSLELLLDDVLDETGKGTLEFDSWNTTFPWEADLKFYKGQYAGIELIPGSGTEYVNPEGMPFVIMEGSHAIMFPHVETQPMMKSVANVPEPSTFTLLAMAGLGAGGYAVRKRGGLMRGRRP